MTAAIASHEPARPRAAVNQPVTWGELFLLLEERPNDLRLAILKKIAEIDARAA